MTSVVEACIDALRPIPFRGKGRLFDRATPTSGHRSVRVWGQYRMDLDLSNVVHRQIFMGCFGHEIAVTIRRLLGRSHTFLDVGAHIGYFSLLAAHRVGGGGRVLAVEPNPLAFEALRKHLGENGVGVVTAEPVALSDVAGTLRLHTPPPGEARDYNVTFLPRPGWEPVDVPAVRLDDRLDDWNAVSIDLMKMDVEGAEPKVLEGGRRHLEAGVVRRLITEVNGPRLVEAGSSPRALVEQLADLGFEPAELRGRKASPIPVSALDLDPEHEYDRLFVHRTATA